MKTSADSLPVDRVAEQLETTELRILMHIKRGQLDGREQDGRWYVTRASLDRFLASGSCRDQPLAPPAGHCRSGCSGCH